MQEVLGACAARSHSKLLDLRKVTLCSDAPPSMTQTQCSATHSRMAHHVSSSATQKAHNHHQQRRQRREAAAVARRGAAAVVCTTVVPAPHTCSLWRWCEGKVGTRSPRGGGGEATAGAGVPCHARWRRTPDTWARSGVGSRTPPCVMAATVAGAEAADARSASRRCLATAAPTAGAAARVRHCCHSRRLHSSSSAVWQRRHCRRSSHGGGSSSSSTRTCSGRSCRQQRRSLLHHASGSSGRGSQGSRHGGGGSSSQQVSWCVCVCLTKAVEEPLQGPQYHTHARHAHATETRTRATHHCRLRAPAAHRPLCGRRGRRA
jgi:hypothetical protein